MIKVSYTWLQFLNFIFTPLQKTGVMWLQFVCVANLLVRNDPNHSCVVMGMFLGISPDFWKSHPQEKSGYFRNQSGKSFLAYDESISRFKTWDNLTFFWNHTKSWVDPSDILLLMVQKSQTYNHLGCTKFLVNSGIDYRSLNYSSTGFVSRISEPSTVFGIFFFGFPGFLGWSMLLGSDRDLGLGYVVIKSRPLRIG